MRRPFAVASLVTLLAVHWSSAQSVPDSMSRPVRWTTVAIVSGVVATTAYVADRSVARSIHDHPSTTRRSTADQLERFGTIAVIGPTVGTLALVGVVAHRKHLVDLGLNTTEAVLMAGAAAQGIKLIAGRERPRDDRDLRGDDFAPFSGNDAFPSGHTAAAFAFATSLGDAIHRPWARVGLYALATGTAWARVAQEAHWLSDVVAGAAVGVMAAKFASGRRTIFGVRAPRFGVSAAGFQVSWDALPWQTAP